MVSEFEVKGRKYLRIVHSGKGKTYHYIGPSEEYRHAEHLHRLLLTNLRDADYVSIASEAIRKAVERLRGLKSGEALKEALRIRKSLTDLIGEIDRFIREMENR
jgi:hypothetical protein